MNRYKLSKAGVDANQGIRRFNNNAEMFEKFLMSFPEDPHFDDMVDSLQKRDVKAAFLAAHSLKGIAGNLSLIRLHERLIPLVEVLRADNFPEDPKLITEVTEAYREVVKALTEE